MPSGHRLHPQPSLIRFSAIPDIFVMSPVADQVYREAYQPFSEDKISLETALEKGTAPLRTFMLGQTRESDLALFARIAKVGDIQEAKDVPMRILIPAFITSELKTAFQIGFTIFIPFLIIDLVVVSVLMALGMMMVPPATVSLPFKLMLFVLVDGWQLLLGSLSQSFLIRDSHDTRICNGNGNRGNENCLNVGSAFIVSGAGSGFNY